jgi:DNA polymerase-3 subunit delta
LVDAITQRDEKAASRLLRRRLDSGDHPLALLGMVVRQIRILIQVKELAEAGLDRQAIARRLRLHAFVVRKALEQEHSFSMKQLEDIHRSLLETDVAIKTGRVDAVLALDMMIAGLTSDLESAGGLAHRLSD